MKFNIGDKVIILSLNLMGTVKEVYKNKNGASCYSVVPLGSHLPYDFYESDLIGISKIEEFKIINDDPAGTPVIDITNLGNHVACPYCKEANKTIKILQKALELAVADKCKFENEWLSMVVGMPNGKLLVPKKEQWYLEQAEKEINNGNSKS